MKHLLVLTLLLSFLGMQHSIAQDGSPAATASLLIEGGIEFGGDEILEVLFTNGGEQKIRAGQGGYISAGAEVALSNVPVLFRSTIGIKYTTTAADNANINFTRLPFNLMAFGVIKDDFRIGAGLTSHLNVRLKGDGFFEDTEFTASPGLRLEAGWQWIALTYSAINYEDPDGAVLSANSIGVALSFKIPNRR